MKYIAIKTFVSQGVIGNKGKEVDPKGNEKTFLDLGFIEELEEEKIVEEVPEETVEKQEEEKIVEEVPEETVEKQEEKPPAKPSGRGRRGGK